MIRPTFLSFETAKRALNVSQAGLDTVGHNIANVNTKGYTRQRVDQVSIHSNYQSKYQIFGSRGQNAGQGADIVGISQIRDPYLDTRYRNEAATYGELSVKNAGFTDLEKVLDEIKTNGVVSQLQDFINQLTKYQKEADSAEYATVVRNSAAQLTQVLNKTASELAGVSEQHLYDLKVSVLDLNSILERIAYLNNQIRETNMYGNPANEMNDERNLLIDQLSEYLPIRVTRTPEKISEDITIERVSIQLVDSSKVPIQAFDLVDNHKFNKFAVGESESGQLTFSLLDGISGFPIYEDISGNINGGGIKGYLDILNGKGDFAGMGENSFKGVPYYQKALDTFAQTFASLMNETNSISVDEAKGKAYIQPYPNKNLFVAVDGSGTITAANITISEEWMAEASFLTTTKQDPSDPKLVTDENGNPKYDDNGNPVYVTTANSDNLLRFISILTESNRSFLAVNGDGREFALFKGSMEEQLTSIQSTLGLDKKLNESLLDASETVISGYSDQRDAISAVSIDEEAINMMTYQNYYNAAARYMTALDEALNTIINGMGVVGR